MVAMKTKTEISENWQPFSVMILGGNMRQCGLHKLHGQHKMGIVASRDYRWQNDPNGNQYRQENYLAPTVRGRSIVTRQYYSLMIRTKSKVYVIGQFRTPALAIAAAKSVPVPPAGARNWKKFYNAVEA